MWAQTSSPEAISDPAKHFFYYSDPGKFPEFEIEVISNLPPIGGGHPPMPLSWHQFPIQQPAESVPMSHLKNFTHDKGTCVLFACFPINTQIYKIETQIQNARTNPLSPSCSSWGTHRGIRPTRSPAS